MPTMTQMPVSSWIAVADNPRQRDTETRAAKAKHLFKPTQSHTVVLAARLPDGTLIKLDGHTRAFLWQTEKVPRPLAVNVVLYDVATLDEAKELYTHFDSDKAVERGAEKISGALRERDITPLSGLLKSGRISQALRVARMGLGFGRDTSVYKTTELMDSPLRLLDSLMLGKATLSTGMVAAVLITLHKHGSAALPFWRAMIAGAGSKIDGEMDGIQAAYELQLWARGKYGESNNLAVCERAVAAYQKWKDNVPLRQMPRPMNLKKYLEVA